MIYIYITPPIDMNSYHQPRNIHFMISYCTKLYKLLFLLAPLAKFQIYRTKAQVVTRLFIGKRYFYFCITSTIYFFLHTCRHCIIPSLRAPLPQPSLQPPPPPHPDSTLCCKNATYLCANKIKSLYSQSLYKFIHNSTRPKILRE